MARQGRPPNRTAAGKYSDNRTAWTSHTGGDIVMLMYPDELGLKDPDEHEYVQGEPGYSIRLTFTRRGRTHSFSLTSMTLAELTAFEEVVKLAIGLARPVVELRDKAAYNAFQEGDESFARIYRQVPQVFVREGNVRKHGGRLLDGFADALARLERAGTANDRVRRDSDRMAEPDEGAGQPEDQSPSAD